MKQLNSFASLSVEELEEHFSNYIIDSWSYSKVSSFSRNEKQFEMSYIYRQPSKMSATTIAGQAYHAALEMFFKDLIQGMELDLVTLQQIAYAHIEEVPGNYWKLQKTTPSVEDCQQKANATVTALLENFMQERSLYLNEISEILDVEFHYSIWVSINGVEIPIPLSFQVDLVFKNSEGKIVVVDHKSKSTFTDDEEIKLIVGKQAITYVKGYEATKDLNVDEVWFVENKYSKNKDGSSQLRLHKVVMDTDTRKLYEALLYEPLKKMIEAISDPDYVYMINDNDTFVDRAELFQFWMQTMIAEVSEFNIPENKKEMVEKRMRKIRDSSLQNISPKIIKNFKENAASFINYDLSGKDMTQAEKIEHILKTFGKSTQVEHQLTGYSSDTFLMNVSVGITVSSIFKHRLDIANALDVNNVRISNELVVYNNKSYLAIEVSKKREKSLPWEPGKLNGSKIPVGVDNLGNTIYWNIENQSTPHVLVAGSTGSGKSVFLISTLEYAKLAGIKRIVILDPKMEFLSYRSNRVEVYTEIEEIELKMRELVEEMNNKIRSGNQDKILVIFDEISDAIASSKSGNELNQYEEVIIGNYKNGSPKTKRECVGTLKSLEQNLQLLLQKGRSSGFRIIAATQRASTKIINGDLKANLPVQVCFRLPKQVDSMVILDEPGAELLCGGGDGLLRSPDYTGLVRFQGFYKG